MNRIKLIIAALLGQFRTANAEGAAGTHGPGALTRRADAATTLTHLLYKKGTDAFHVAVCGATDYPVGLSTDQPEAAEDIINIAPLGSSTQGTRKVRVATAINDEVALFTAANGLASATGTSGMYGIGRSVAVAVQTGSGDYLIEFAPKAPVVVP